MAIYARVSTRDKGQNPEIQLEPMRKYCTAMDWQIFGEYVDKAQSSDLDGRKKWTQLLEDASKHKFDILCIWKLDRAFRSNQHAANTLTTLNGYKVGFRSLMDPAIDTTTPNGQLLFNILASVAQFEKDLIIQRVNAGMEYAKSHGTKSGKPIGRPRADIPLQTICKALVKSNGNLSGAASILTTRFDKKVSPGFVSLRISRAGFTKEDVLSGKALQKLGSENSDN